MAGRKTSVYLSEQLAAEVEQSGIPLAELVRRGLAADTPDPIEDQLARIQDAIAALPGTDDIHRTVTDAIDQRQQYG